MPSVGTHILIMEKTIKSLLESSDPKVKEIGKFLKDNEKIAYLGSIGPDLFYFTEESLKYINTCANIIGTASQEVKKFFDGIESLLKDGQKSLIPGVGLVSHIGEEGVKLVESSTGVILKSIDVYLLDLVDLFASVYASFYKSPNLSAVHGLATLADLPSDGNALNGKPETNWGWGTILHSQASGTFSLSLLKSITGKDFLDTGYSSKKTVAYLMGFLSHLSGDIAGHPYVNQIVGGPARNHNWRHRLSELTIDKYLWQLVKNEDISLTSLNALVAIDDSLKDEISNHLYNACKEVHSQREKNTVCGSNRKINSPPDKKTIYGYIDNLIAALELFHQIDIPYPDAPDTFTPSEAINEATEKIGQAADKLLPDNIDDIGDVIKGILGASLLLAYAVEIIAESLIASAVSLGFSIPLSGLYILEVALYYIFYALRRLFVYVGVLYPDDLMMQESYAKQFLNGFWEEAYPHQRDVIKGISAYDVLKGIFIETFAAVPVGVGTEIAKKFTEMQGRIINILDGKPALKTTLIVVDKNPFIYPTSPLEEPLTLSGPYVKKGPEHFVEGGKFDIKSHLKYCSLNSPQETDNYNATIKNWLLSPNAYPPLGNAVDISKYFIQSLLLKGMPCRFNDWHLDSDRGYGHKFWIIPDGKDLLGKIEIKGYCKNPQP